MTAGLGIRTGIYGIIWVLDFFYVLQRNSSLCISCCFRRELEAEVSKLRTKVETLEAKYVLNLCLLLIFKVNIIFKRNLHSYNIFRLNCWK